MKSEDIRYYNVTTPSDLRCLCIKKDWFSCGTNRQYEKLFDMNAAKDEYTVHDIALLIWACSDTDSSIESLNQIEAILEDTMWDYLEQLALRVADEAEAQAERNWIDSL